MIICGGPRGGGQRRVSARAGVAPALAWPLHASLRGAGASSERTCAASGSPSLPTRPAAVSGSIVSVQVELPSVASVLLSQGGRAATAWRDRRRRAGAAMRSPCGRTSSPWRLRGCTSRPFLHVRNPCPGRVSLRASQGARSRNPLLHTSARILGTQPDACLVSCGDQKSLAGGRQESCGRTVICRHRPRVQEPTCVSAEVLANVMCATRSCDLYQQSFGRAVQLPLPPVQGARPSCRRPFFRLLVCVGTCTHTSLRRQDCRSHLLGDWVGPVLHAQAFAAMSRACANVLLLRR